MEIVLTRDVFLGSTTLGTLTVDGKPFAHVCEDLDRGDGPKVHGETAIPVGRYRVKTTWSKRFQRLMPEVIGVPGFGGVRLHPGNSSADTEGCLLVGLDRTATGVARSRAACRWLDKAIAAAEARGEAVWITVERDAEAWAARGAA